MDKNTPRRKRINRKHQTVFLRPRIDDLFKTLCLLCIFAFFNVVDKYHSHLRLYTYSQRTMNVTWSIFLFFERIALNAELL